MQDSCFIKIPKGLRSISPKNARLYGAYLDFKMFSNEGVIKEFLRDKFYYQYWIKLLVKAGWASRNNDGSYSLKSYQHVWRALNVDRYWSKKANAFKFYYRKISIEELPQALAEYKITLRKIILQTVVDNKTRAIKWRLNNARARKRTNEVTETFISSRTIAKLFELRSPASGSKYRKKFFHLIEEPTVLDKFQDGTWRYRCKRVAL